MAHAQKPDLAFQRNGRVHLSRRGCQFSRLLAVEECGSTDSNCIDRVPAFSARLLATHSIRIFPLHFPSRASPCAIRFRTRYTISWHGSELPWRSNVSRHDSTRLQQSPIKRKVKSVLSAFKFVSTYYKLVSPQTEREPLIDKLTSDLRSSTLGHLHRVVRRTSSYDFAAGCVLKCRLDSFKTHLLMSVKVVDSLSVNCMV